MYIKELIIDGFKSYSQRTVVEMLDERHNVIVGRNGSGKSNFFSAIEFVLSDEYNHLRTAERVALINKGANSPTATAYVEVVFDKSPIPVQNNGHAAGGSISRIRRTITQIKDQFTINGRNATRKEVDEFLEYSGLSSSNPYYIVKQGKINQLATARPKQLLDVLFDIAGVRVYDEKRIVTLKHIQNADQQFEQIRSDRASMDKTLQRLAKEKAELEEYERFDKQHRVLQYLVLEKKCQQTTNELDSLSQTEKMYHEQRQDAVQRKMDVLEQLVNLKQLYKENHDHLNEMSSQKAELSDQYICKEKQIEGIRLKLTDMQHDVAVESKCQLNDREQLNALNEDIARREVELHKVTMKCTASEKRRDKLNDEHLKMEQQRNALLDKQRRGLQFTSQIERDRWIEKELVNVRKYLTDKTEWLHEAKIELDQHKSNIFQAKDSHATDETNFAEMLRKEESYKIHLNKCKATNRAKTELRDELLLKESNLQQLLTKCEDDLTQLELTMRKQSNAAAFQGWKSVRKVLDMLESQGGRMQHIRQGYHGRVLENFRCDEDIYRAVETAAGSKLFNHIVSSDVVAQSFIGLCNQHKLSGDFQFMPLNRLQPKDVRYPEDASVRPLISLLEYDQMLAPAFRMIFGQTLLCHDLETAGTAARRYQMTCVTLDGDLVRAGVLTGGYRAPRRSILDLQQRWGIGHQNAQQLTSELNLIRGELQRTKDTMGSCELDIFTHETKVQKLRQSIEALQCSIRGWPERRKKLQEEYSAKETKIRASKTEQELLGRRLAGLQIELRTPLTGELSDNDRREIERLDGEMRKNRTAAEHLFPTELKQTKLKAKLENMLHSNLLPRRDELKESLERSEHTHRRAEVATLEREEYNINERIIKLLHEIESIDKRIKEATTKDASLSGKLTVWQQKLQDAEDAIANGIPALASYEARKEKLERKMMNHSEEIKALGALPAIDKKYRRMAMNALTKELEHTNKYLKKYAHVNKKASDEYSKMWQDVQELNKRMSIMEKTRKNFDTILQGLQQQRTECIEDTFENVNRNFTEIFAKFVPKGCGKLILNTTNDPGGEDVDGRAVDTEDMAMNRYVGLGVEVSFVGKRNVITEMKRLSGGQKTIVAISLISAIQRHKPPPFHLYDEIDQALDVQYRKGVAEMIKLLSASSQFITITFRRELLEHAHKFYGVRCMNKTSHIGVVTKEQAYNFVVDDAVHQ